MTLQITIIIGIILGIILGCIFAVGLTLGAIADSNEVGGGTGNAEHFTKGEGVTFHNGSYE